MNVLDILKRHIWTYILEVIIAVIIFNISLEAFLIYVFIMLLIKLDAAADYITEHDIDEIIEETKGNLTQKQLTSLENDFRDLIGN